MLKISSNVFVCNCVPGIVPLCINLPRDRNGPIRQKPAALFCFTQATANVQVTLKDLYLAQKHFSNKVQTPQSLYWTYIRKFTRCYRCEIKSFFLCVFSTLSWFGNTSQILGLLCGFGPTCGVSSTWETRTHPFGMTQMSSCSRYREFEFKRSLYLLYGAVCWLFTVYYA